jgi:3-oxoacyl-[acyl-carrier protein] reductase
MFESLLKHINSHLSTPLTDSQAVTHATGMIGSEVLIKTVAETPLGRLGQPEDIAETVVYLASANSGWVTGERIGATGGLK